MDEDLKDIASILNALRRSASNPASYRQSMDEVDLHFKTALREEASRRALAPAGMGIKVRRAAKSVLLVLRPPETSKEVLDRLRLSCNLAEPQIRLLKNIGLISTDSIGRPVMRERAEVLLTQEKAAGYLFLIGCLVSLAIVSVIADPHPVESVIRGFGLSIAIGSAANFVLGRSFRAYPIAEKVEAAAPWVNKHGSNPA